MEVAIDLWFIANIRCSNWEREKKEASFVWESKQELESGQIIIEEKEEVKKQIARYFF